MGTICRGKMVGLRKPGTLVPWHLIVMLSLMDSPTGLLVILRHGTGRRLLIRPLRTRSDLSAWVVVKRSRRSGPSRKKGVSRTLKILNGIIGCRTARTTHLIRRCNRHERSGMEASDSDHHLKTTRTATAHSSTTMTDGTTEVAGATITITTPLECPTAHETPRDIRRT